MYTLARTVNISKSSFSRLTPHCSIHPCRECSAWLSSHCEGWPRQLRKELLTEYFILWLCFCLLFDVFILFLSLKLSSEFHLAMFCGCLGSLRTIKNIGSYSKQWFTEFTYYKLIIRTTQWLLTAQLVVCLILQIRKLTR